MPDEFDAWTDTRRRDGVSVRATRDGRWIVQHPHHPPLAECPCCGKDLPSERTAKLLAEAVYPLAGNA